MPREWSSLRRTLGVLLHTKEYEPRTRWDGPLRNLSIMRLGALEWTRLVYRRRRRPPAMMCHPHIHR
jgi:hypothetical protein